MSNIVICSADFDSETEIEKINSKIQALSDNKDPIMNSSDLENLENELEELCNQLKAIIIGKRIQSSMYSDKLQKEEKSLIESSPKKMTSNGYKPIDVKLKCGMTITIETRVYYGKGRIKKGRIVRPGLLLLGIHDQCTLALGSQISKIVAALGSIEEAKSLLESSGINLSVNTIRNIAYCWGKRARLYQGMDKIEFGEREKGRVICCGIDGGRIRIRTNKRGPKTKKNRAYYHTDWREPKLLIIYIVNGEGRRDTTVCPIIDGTMKGPDAIFRLMHYYLSRVQITEADRIVFTADGAKWIWERVQALMTSLNLAKNQVFLTLDFYHAVQHLNKVAGLCVKWNPEQRQGWVNRLMKRLQKGMINQVIEEIRACCRGRNSSSIRAEMMYFLKHKEHMNYSTNLAQCLPIGSGAVESAVRRVINLRVKGPGIFWKTENAEVIILLRSYYKSGWWKMLENMSLSTGMVII